MQVRVGKKKTTAELLESICLFCLVVPLIKPDGINSINAVLANLIWNVGQQIAGCVCVLFFVLYFCHKKTLSLSGCIMFVLLFITVLLTYFKGGSIQYWYINYSNAVYITMLFEIYQDKLEKLIRAVLAYLVILLTINLVCMIIYPNGMYITRPMNYTLNWFLGYKSSLQYYVIPAIVLGWIERNYLGKKNIFRFLLFISLIETFYSQNTMLLVVLCLLVLCLALKIYKCSPIFNGITYIYAGLSMNFLVLFYVSVFVHSSWGRALFDFFGKDLTLSGRSSKIWPRALYYINKEFLFGYGVISSEAHVGMLGMPAAIHAHNQILELMICGGVFLLLLFIGVLTILGIRMLKSKELEVTQVLGLSIFAILLMISVEVFTRGCGTGIWLIFLLAGVSQQIHQQYESVHVNKKNMKRKIRFHAW